jgi:hypothetical protein
MEMIRHKRPGKHLAWMFLYGYADSVQKIIVIRGAKEYPSSFDPSGNDMMKQSGNINPRLSRHATSLHGNNKKVN